MRTGPEHVAGWRGRYETQGGLVTISANHHPRRRMPTPHEAAMQTMRGRPVDMVSEVNHEWRMSVPGMPPALVRTHPNGRFHTNALHREAYATIEELARAWGGYVARLRGLPAPDGPDEPEAPGPRP